MEYLYAPLEGICYPEYRYLHFRAFPGVDRYYAPFLAPGGGGYKQDFIEKKLRDAEQGVPLVPQLMANDPEKFLAAARIMADLGFKEVNLNAGCPSGTVFSKHKGAGMLQDLDSLRAFLDRVFEHSPVSISVKTRIGVRASEEFDRIMELYNRYPISLLIIHPRVREQFYKGKPDTECFLKASESSSLKICYNGNVFTPADFEKLQTASPTTEYVMLGRGAVANPALFRMLEGGEPLSISEFSLFHDSLLDAYLSIGLGDYGALRRMKELWYYMKDLFPGCHSELKRLLRSNSMSDYRCSLNSLLSSGRFDGSAGFIPQE